MILFDIPINIDLDKDINSWNPRESVLELIAQLNITQMVSVPKNHLVYRSFYLLNSLPGKYMNEPVYLEQSSINNERVSGIILGSHDWASAWATNTDGLPLFPTIPGDNNQREYAYRFGINLVMYALTGNYKADQVHINSILKRLKK